MGRMMRRWFFGARVTRSFVALRSLYLILGVLGLAAAPSACSSGNAPSSLTIDSGEPHLAEDCGTPGDEDGNGVADCQDPVCAGTPTCVAGCGNGHIDPGEQCDDGNHVNGDGCESDCTASCGNGIMDANEACDDGNRVNGDGCENDCTLPVCGNGVLDDGEHCDDGNRVNGDSCENDCSLPVCGNAIKDFFEQCDDGNRVNGDGCENDCSLPVCGNGITDVGEACDDGNRVNGDDCENDCSLPVCGNGVLDDGEHCDDGNRVNGDSCENDCSLPVCGNAIKDFGEQCDDGNASNGDGCDPTCRRSTYTYVKASNTGQLDYFGTSIALSADGSTLAVGAPGESSAATGVDGDQSNNAAESAGAVYVYVRAGASWVQQAYLKASNTNPFDQFGTSVALSADGSTLAVGAPTSDEAPGPGAVYVFTRSGPLWSPQPAIMIPNPRSAFDEFGWSVALSGDGMTLAIGAMAESSQATGIDGDPGTTSAPGAGAAYVFTRAAVGWIQQAYIKASNTGAGDSFGYAIALTGDGSTLAVGATGEDSNATGIGGSQTNNAAPAAGAVYTFTRTGTAWTQQAYIKASNTNRGDLFGGSVTLSADGSTLAVGAVGEDSAATGVNGDQASNAVLEAGASYVFARAGNAWTQQAYVKASNTSSTQQFGWSVALSPDGAVLAVGAEAEDCAAIGINGGSCTTAATASGAVYRFTRDGAAWHPEAYIKASNTGAGDEFGFSVALAADGTLAVGANGEWSAATGINGNQANNSSAAAGAVYVVR